jgi:hypothetical protein
VKIALKDIRPNPYRDFVRNPLKQSKIEELRASIKETGFWENIEVRKAPDGKGYEMAYGHHRKAAAELEGITEANFIVRSLSNEMMLRKMARENSETYGSNDVLSTIEIVAAVVKGYAEGTLTGLQPAEDNDRADSFRSAPFFARGRFTSENKSEHIYNTLSLAIYLGFTSKQKDKVRPANKVVAALNALELIELKELSYKQISEYENTRQMLSETTRLLQNRKSRLEKEKADAERAKRDHEEAKLNREKAEAEAKRAREEGEAIRTRLASLQAEEKAAREQEEQRRTKALALKREQIRQKVQDEQRALERKNAREQELANRIVLAKKEEQAAEKEVAGTEAELEKKAAKQAAKEYEGFITYSQTLRDNLDRFLSTESDMYDRLKKWINDPRVTDELRGLLQLSLRDLSARAANFNPFPVKPATLKDKKK